jgi:peptide/nickel transport system substrate-binding protein
VIRRRLAAASLVFAFAAGAGGCGQKGKDAGSVVQRRLEGEPSTLNPILATTDMENVVLALLERNLLDYDENLDLVPGLAESVAVSPDARTYAVTLREGARWEDGRPVTSEDVAFTLRTLADPKTPALSRKSFWEGMEKVEVVDARTARVAFRTPYSGRIHAFNVGLLPAAEYQGSDVSSNPRNRRPLANGPYRLAKWDSGRLELVRNTQYFGPKAGPEMIVFRVVPESAPAFEALLAGELHEMRLSSEQKKRLDGSSPPAAARAIVFDELMYTYIGWRNSNPLFSSPKVRRALTMLIDREAIARTLYGGLAKPAVGPVPPGFWTFDPELKPWPYDPAAAGALLDEAGFRKGPDGVRARGNDRLAFTLLLGAGSDLQRQITEVVQQGYRKAGIDMTIQPLEWAAFAARVDAGDFDASILALSLDPNPDLYPFWHSSQKAPSGWNTVGYRNPTADAVMEEIRTTFDREKTRALFKELQRVIHEDEPVTFLHVGSRRWGLNRKLEDVRTSPYGLFLFWPGGSAWRMGRGLGPV